MPPHQQTIVGQKLFLFHIMIPETKSELFSFYTGEVLDKNISVKPPRNSHKIVKVRRYVFT
jgi:hypothetical protein